MSNLELYLMCHHAFIARYLLDDLRNTEPQERLNLAFKWLKRSEETENEVKKDVYWRSFNVLYQEVTGLSYQSNIAV